MRSYRRKGAKPFTKQRRPSQRTRKENSPRKRGYDANWDKLSLWYRGQVNGLCEECYRRGVIKACSVVDHMIPVRDDPGRRLDPSNLDALCDHCHNGFKRRIEKYARAVGEVFMLPLWMKHPETRPAHFQFRKVEPSVVNGIAFNRPAGEGLDEIAVPLLFNISVGSQCLFEGAGSIVELVNYSNTEIEVIDGNEPVFVIADGDRLKSRLEIKNGLTIVAEFPGEGKISVAYVQESKNGRVV